MTSSTRTADPTRSLSSQMLVPDDPLLDIETVSAITQISHERINGRLSDRRRSPLPGAGSFPLPEIRIAGRNFWRRAAILDWIIRAGEADPVALLCCYAEDDGRIEEALAERLLRLPDRELLRAREAGLGPRGVRIEANGVVLHDPLWLGEWLRARRAD